MILALGNSGAAFMEVKLALQSGTLPRLDSGFECKVIANRKRYGCRPLASRDYIGRATSPIKPVT